MFESSFATKTKHHNYLFTQPNNNESNLELPQFQTRQKYHNLLSQNFTLKTKLDDLQKQNINLSQQKKQLKKQLKILLQEINLNDRVIIEFKTNQGQYMKYIKIIEQTIQQMEQQIKYYKQIIEQLNSYNQHIEMECKIVADMKQQYYEELIKIKLINQSIVRQNYKLRENYQEISKENTIQLKQNRKLQVQVKESRQQLYDYEKYVIQKVNNANNGMQNHQKCEQNYRLIYDKYQKYKCKAHHYKNRSDQLLTYFQSISKQIDTNTLRKYYQQYSE